MKFVGNHSQTETAISWARACAIFGNARPPTVVWEQQFDFCQGALEQLASKPYEAIEPADYWYYFHDLTYVDLQPDLFHYLFPACLMRWHQTLQENEPCSQGDSDFHHGLLRGQILDKMLTPEQREQVIDFFTDSLLQRLDREREDQDSRAMGAWLLRLNSLGMVLPNIERIWRPWWSVATPGRAWAVLQYCSGLIFDETSNPLFDVWSGGKPHFWEHDSMNFGYGWQPASAAFLKSWLTSDNVTKAIELAVLRLQGEPEYDLARQVATGAVEHSERLALRIAELPDLLLEPEKSKRSWSL